MSTNDFLMYFNNPGKDLSPVSNKGFLKSKLGLVSSSVSTLEFSDFGFPLNLQ